MKSHQVNIQRKDFNRFEVTNLIPGTKYELKVIAKNKQGPSEALYLNVETFLLPSELIAETKVKKNTSSNERTKPYFQIVVICVSTFLVTDMLILCIILKMRKSRRLESPVVSMTLLQKEHSTQQARMTTMSGCEGPLLCLPDNLDTSQVS